MGSKKLFLFLALIISVSSIQLAQISEITRLPVQNASQSLKEFLLSIYMKVKTLINEFQKADRYEVNFNANSIASGVYIYQLRVNEFITSKKMILIK